MPQAYYKLLLRGIKADPYLGSKSYQLVLNRDLRKRGKQIETPAIEDEAEPDDPNSDRIIVPGAEQPDKHPHPKRARTANLPKRTLCRMKTRATPVAGGGGSGPGPSVPPPIAEPPGGGDVSPPTTPAKGPEGGSDSEVAEDVIVSGPAVPDLPQPKRRKLGRDWVDALCGAVISYKEYQATSKAKPYKNYIIKCTQGHPGCIKTCGRSGKVSKAHGELGVLAFLHAWLDIPENKEGAHNLGEPSDAATVLFLEEHKAELLNLFHTLVPSP